MVCQRKLAAAMVVAVGGASSMSFAATWSAFGAPPDQLPTLQLRTGGVNLSREPNSLRGTPVIDRTRLHVIVLRGTMNASRRASLERAGVVIRDFIPPNAFVVDLSRADLGALRAMPFVSAAIAYRDAWKIDPALQARPTARRFIDPQRDAAERAGVRLVTVQTSNGAQLAADITAISRIARVEFVDAEISGDDGIIIVRIPQEGIQDLAKIAGVRFVEEAPEFGVRNDSVRWLVQSGIEDVTPLYDNGLTGAGQILGILDTAVSVDHCSFFDTDPIGQNHRKIVAYNTATGYGAHGTHVAGIAVGDAGVWEATRGVAYGARLVYNSIPSSAESTVFGRFDLHASQGARVHSNSWGSDSTVSYTGAVRAIDNFSWLQDSNLVVVAVSNQSVIHIPENAKNCLAVAASFDTPDEDFACSGGAGPTADGRRKPEVMSPGCNIESSGGATGCATRFDSGTSMAAPSVSGVALLTRQYFMDGFYPTGTSQPENSFEPSGALVKAMVVNSAVDMTGISGYPSNLEGWGRVVADNSLHFSGDERRLVVRETRNNNAGALSTGGQVTVRVRVADPSEQLRVTASWHDHPAAVNSVLTPVNNLDLVVSGPNDALYLGNVFSGGRSSAGGTADVLNNLEQVHVTNPTSGVWTITLDAAAVNMGTQGYAIVVTGGVVCPPDFNGDGFVTGDDYDLFIAAFEAGDISADYVADGFVTGDDFDVFIADFELGC